MGAKIISRQFEKCRQLIARNIEFCNHFRAFDRCCEMSVKFLVIVVNIDAKLVRIGPVALARGGEVVGYISLVGFFRIGVGEIIEFAPIAIAEFAVSFGHIGIVWQGAVAGEYAGMQKIFRFHVG